MVALTIDREVAERIVESGPVWTTTHLILPDRVEPVAVVAAASASSALASAMLRPKARCCCVVDYDCKRCATLPSVRRAARRSRFSWRGKNLALVGRSAARSGRALRSGCAARAFWLPASLRVAVGVADVAFLGTPRRVAR